MTDPSARGGAVERWMTLATNIGILAVIGWIAWQLPHTRKATGPERPSVPLPREPVSLEGANFLGSTSASIAMLEFSDFKCPYCRRFATDVLPALKTEFIDTGKVRLAFRQFPLPAHQGARELAAAALCASEQGQFWSIHDAFFARAGDWSTDQLATEAAGLNVPTAAFRSCLSDGAEKQIEKDLAAGKALGVSGTPTFFVGRMLPDGRLTVTTRIAGARPLEGFEVAFKTELGKAQE